MEWNVYRIDVTRKRIEEFNIFDHHYFFRSCAAIAKNKRISKQEFSNRIERELFYYFRTKFEYEVWLGYIFDNKDEYTRKIDIYQQVMMNYPKFIDYVWKNRAELRFWWSYENT